MGLFLKGWFSYGLDILEGIIKTNETKIALLKKADEEKFERKIKELEDEIEEIKTEIARREKSEEIE